MVSACSTGQRHFPKSTYIGILINGAGNQTRNLCRPLLIVAKDVRECVCKGRCALDSAEMDLANVGTVIEAKDCSRLVQSDMLRHATDVLVESTAHEVPVAKDECLLRVEPNGNDVLGVVRGVALNLLDRPLLTEQVLFVVGHHNYKRYVEHILQPSVALINPGCFFAKE